MSTQILEMNKHVHSKVLFKPIKVGEEIYFEFRYVLQTM